MSGHKQSQGAGGGVNIGSDVNTGGGDFIGRDKLTNITANRDVNISTTIHHSELPGRVGATTAARVISKAGDDLQKSKSTKWFYLFLLWLNIALPFMLVQLYRYTEIDLGLNTWGLVSWLFLWGLLWFRVRYFSERINIEKQEIKKKMEQWGALELAQAIELVKFNNSTSRSIRREVTRILDEVIDEQKQIEVLEKSE